jgi:hypothetical protein
VEKLPYGTILGVINRLVPGGADNVGENAFRIPFVNFEIPRPKVWDLAGLAVIVTSLLLAGVNLGAAFAGEPGRAVTTGLTAGIVLMQLLVASLSLLVLGKTAKSGTIWGNLAALVGLFAGISGVLLAAVLWTAA